MFLWSLLPTSHKHEKSASEGGSSDHHNPRSLCLVKGTKILMGNGKMENIEDVNVGDTIKTVFIDSLKICNSVIYKECSPEHDEIVTIQFSDGSENSNTFDHSYFVKQKGWCSYNPDLTKARYNINAKKIEIGDIVYKYELGRLKEIKIVSISYKIKRTQTYTLFTEGLNHNFFANGILVHNESIEE